MPRADENGKSLESLLVYMLDGVSAQDISAALGVSLATYHRRKHADDYPDAEDLRLIAAHFGLNPVGLMVSFGLVSRGDVDSAVSAMRPLAVMTERKVKTKREPRFDPNAPGL